MLLLFLPLLCLFGFLLSVFLICCCNELCWYAVCLVLGVLNLRAPCILWSEKGNFVQRQRVSCGGVWCKQSDCMGVVLVVANMGVCTYLVGCNYGKEGGWAGGGVLVGVGYVEILVGVGCIEVLVGMGYSGGCYSGVGCWVGLSVEVEMVGVETGCVVEVV